MDPAEFDALAEPLRREPAESVARWGLALVEDRTSTPEEIAGRRRPGDASMIVGL